jgi:hypothetical protein
VAWLLDSCWLSLVCFVVRCNSPVFPSPAGAFIWPSVLCGSKTDLEGIGILWPDGDTASKGEPTVPGCGYGVPSG